MTQSHSGKPIAPASSMPYFCPMQELIIGGIYRHYKNKNYRVLGTARHSETLEDLVLYECLYANELGQIWVRPRENFFGSVIRPAYNGPRFAHVPNAISET